MELSIDEFDKMIKIFTQSIWDNVNYEKKPDMQSITLKVDSNKNSELNNQIFIEETGEKIKHLGIYEVNNIRIWVTKK